MLRVMNECDIVANTQAAINEAFAGRCQNNWTLAQLVDKPDTGEVYLIWSKPCVAPEQPAP